MDKELIEQTLHAIAMLRAKIGTKSLTFTERTLISKTVQALLEAKDKEAAQPQAGQEISVDVSTEDGDAGNRIFARLTGDVSGDVWLAEEASRNFAAQPQEAGQAREAFDAWLEKRGVWPRLTYEEVFFAGMTEAQAALVAVPDGWREYMKHKPDCLGGLSGNHHPCTCGLEAIYAAPAAPAVSADTKDAERISTLREAVIEAADEWSQYVLTDIAPRKCSEHVGMAFDAAQSKGGTA